LVCLPIAAKYEVTADEDMLREVVVNFVGNAIKYSNAGGEVRVAIVDLGNGRVRFEVKDKGIGIGSKDVKNLFRQFYRVDSELVQNEQGSGLGLYISKKYVESMGGEVGVDSEIGKGQRVFI
jgi:two-component system, OmpR family, sensor kinase